MKITPIGYKPTFKNNNNNKNGEYKNIPPQYDINSEFEKKYQKPTIAIIREYTARELKRRIEKVNTAISAKESEFKKQLSSFEAGKQKIITMAKNTIQMTTDEREELQIIRMMQIKLAELEEQKREKAQQIGQEILALYAESQKMQMQLERIYNPENPIYY